MLIKKFNSRIFDNYKTKYYNLDDIIAVGFKVNSKRAVEFRLWAINILKQYFVKGYVLDKEKLKKVYNNGVLNASCNLLNTKNQFVKK